MTLEILWKESLIYTLVFRNILRNYKKLENAATINAKFHTNLKITNQDLPEKQAKYQKTIFIFTK